MGEKIPLLKKVNTQPKLKEPYVLTDCHKSEFRKMVEMCEEAIQHGVNPSLIPQGSSGSYFVYDKDKNIIGVFKPKNEEPYGKKNPKWLKWIQRVFCPCFFGRSCILPNKGFLSEAGAYIVDEMLGLDIVPPTFVTKLTSTSFNYSRLDRSNAKTKTFLKSNFANVCQGLRSGLPPKLGSFQKYVHGYKSCSHFLNKFDSEPLSEESAREFQFLFEKMVVLDYIIRNTDRSDNWLIKMEYPENGSTSSLENDNKHPKSNLHQVIKLAAIDNGLAFPFKHPDSWRSYPFHWASLEYAKIPFSTRTKTLLMPKLSSDTFADDLESELFFLFMVERNFNVVSFRDQMAVLRGQISNLRTALDNEYTPEQLSAMRPVYVTKLFEDGGSSSKIIEKIHEKSPLFRRI